MTEAEFSARLTAFLEALPGVADDEFVNAIGVGTFRAKHVRRGLERGVLTTHWTGYGLCIAQPKEHGICPHCSAAKSRSICEHCNCSMCSWLRMTDERNSPQVSREKLQQLIARLKAFTFSASARPTGALDDDILL